MSMGLGWVILGEGDLLFHNGGTLGARSEVRVERHSGRAIVVLCDGRRGTDRAAGSLLDPCGRRDRPRARPRPRTRNHVTYR